MRKGADNLQVSSSESNLVFFILAGLPSAIVLLIGQTSAARNQDPSLKGVPPQLSRPQPRRRVNLASRNPNKKPHRGGDRGRSTSSRLRNVARRMRSNPFSFLFLLFCLKKSFRGFLPSLARGSEAVGTTAAVMSSERLQESGHVFVISRNTWHQRGDPGKESRGDGAHASWVGGRGGAGG